MIIGGVIRTDEERARRLVGAMAIHARCSAHIAQELGGKDLGD